MSTSSTELQRGRWRLEDGPDGPEQVEDHSGRDGHGRIAPAPQREPRK